MGAIKKMLTDRKRFLVANFANNVCVMWQICESSSMQLNLAASLLTGFYPLLYISINFDSKKKDKKKESLLLQEDSAPA